MLGIAVVRDGLRQAVANVGCKDGHDVACAVLVGGVLGSVLVRLDPGDGEFIGQFAERFAHSVGKSPAVEFRKHGIKGFLPQREVVLHG
jgi:hypothetical protein